MSGVENEYLSQYHLDVNPFIKLRGNDQEPLVQLTPNEGNTGSGIALVRDADGDFRSLGVYINQTLTETTQASNIKILTQLFKLIRAQTGKTVQLAGYGPHYGLDPEGKRHVLYLGGQDIATVEFTGTTAKNIILQEPFDTGSAAFIARVKSIAEHLFVETLKQTI